MADRIFESRINIFIFSFVLFSAGSFYAGFFPPDEPKYVDAALHMIKTGNYIVPFFNCHIRFDKPILYYLEIVIFFKLFFIEHFLKIAHDPLGIIEYAARLPSIITGSFTVLFTYLTSLKMFNDKNMAKNSSIALLSFFFYFYLTRAVYPDASLILFELAAIYFFIGNRYVIAWIFVALAFLTKGPIGIVIPGFTYFLYLWTVEKKTGLKEFFSLKNLSGFAVFLIVSMPWYIIMYRQYGGEFINRFLLYHNIERFTGGASQHPHSFFYYIPVIAAALYLWFGYLKQLIQKIDIHDKQNIFLLLWSAWIVLFFSISSNKLVHYIAPAFIPLAIIFGRYLEELKNSGLASSAMFIFELLISLGLSYYLYMQNLDKLIPTALFGIFFLSLLNFLNKPSNVIFYKVIFLSIVASFILIQFESYRPEKRIWRIVANRPERLYEYKINNQSLVAYTRKCLEETRNPNIFLTARKPFYIYTKEKHIKEIKVPYKIMFSSKDKGTSTEFLLVK